MLDIIITRALGRPAAHHSPSVPPVVSNASAHVPKRRAHRRGWGLHALAPAPLDRDEQHGKEQAIHHKKRTVMVTRSSE